MLAGAMTLSSTPHPAPPARPRVIVTRRLPAEVEARMEELFDVRLNPDDAPMSREALAAAMRTCDVLVPAVTDSIDAELIEQAAPQLGMIANFGSGTEHIDVAAARKRGILVTNTPSVFTDDTADLAMALIIFAMRGLGTGSAALAAGRWEGWSPTSMLGHSLMGKTLGLVGMGRIGQALAHRARAFGMTVRYHNRHPVPASIENMVQATFEPDLDRLIGEADVISLHCPVTPATRHLINAERLAEMKPTACLINTGRGALIDEAALIKALETGQIGSAGLDVYDSEPDVNPALLRAPNLVALPHLGSATHEGRTTAGHRIIANIRFWVDGHRPPDQVIPEI